MAVPSSIETAYLQVVPSITSLARYVGSTLRPWCEVRNYLYRDRLKGLDSVAEKLETGRYKRWSDLDDLFACTIVVPTTAHEGTVLEFLDSVFIRAELRARNSTVKAPEVFRFDSTRFIGYVQPTGNSELAPGADAIKFEVQVPTIFEHAWSVVTHDLAYKADDADWRRARLAAQLKSAVEQIELIVAGFEANIDFVAASAFPETDVKQEIVNRFKQLQREGKVSAELVPTSWSRFANNVYALVRSYSSRYQAPNRAMQLCEAVERYLRADNPLADIHSGSLFQAVLGVVHSGAIPNANLDDFVVVESSELRDVHGVDAVSKAFVFDQWRAAEP